MIYLINDTKLYLMLETFAKIFSFSDGNIVLSLDKEKKVLVNNYY